MKDSRLFQVGQFVETRSFQQGYRGAWFNCKIIHKKGDSVSLQYCDFPDERLHWTRIFQKPQGRKTIDGKKQLMLRPCFPQIYHESQLPNPSTISGVAVVVKDVWRVGDLVDWRADDCNWSGKITEVFGNGKYKIELLPHPFGEGAFYEGTSDQLRPSLEWSPQEGWTLATPLSVPGWENCRSPARLINATKREESTLTSCVVNNTEKEVTKKTDVAVDNGKKEIKGKTDAVSQHRVLCSPCTSSGSLSPSNGFSQMGKGRLASKESERGEKAGNVAVEDSGVSRPNFFASMSSLQARKASKEVSLNSSENGKQPDCGPSNKIGNDGSNPIEAAASLPPPSGLEKRMTERLNDSSKKIKNSETDVNVWGKRPSSTSSERAVNIGVSSSPPDAGCSKKMITDGNFSFNFTNSNSFEAAILDLEELVNKVKWIKGILQFGLPNSPPSWKFIEHRASSLPK